MYAGSFADMTRAAFYRATMWYRAAIVASSLACGLLSDFNAQAIKAAELPPAQREAIEGIIHDYVLKNPDVLIEALQNAQDKLNHEADAKATKVLSERASEIFDDPATPVGGNPKGDVNIVEFFDYRCPYCKQVLPALQSLLKEDHELRFVYMEFPVLGPASVVAARAALAARQQGKYEAFHTAMMATKGQITEDTVYEVAGSVGIDVDRLKQNMNAPEIDQALKENLTLAKALNIRGTPGPTRRQVQTFRSHVEGDDRCARFSLWPYSPALLPAILLHPHYQDRGREIRNIEGRSRCTAPTISTMGSSSMGIYTVFSISCALRSTGC